MITADSHILLRYAQVLDILEDPIAEHQAVLASYGEVWFGKIGRAFGQGTLSTIGDQIAEGRPTFLFLVRRKGPREFVVHKATLLSMTRESPDGNGLVPEYYARAGIRRRVGTWFRISSLDRVNPVTLSALIVARTGTPVPNVIGSSRNPMFIVAAKVGGKI